MSQRIEGIRAALAEHGLRLEVLVRHPQGGERALFFDAREYDMGFEAVKRLFARRIPIPRHRTTTCGGGCRPRCPRNGDPHTTDLSVASFGGFFTSEVVQQSLPRKDRHTWSSAQCVQDAR